MSLDPDLEEQTLLRQTFARDLEPLSGRELAAALLTGACVALTAALVWWTGPRHSWHVLPGALAIVLLVLASRVSIATPFGFTAPTQLAFVPALFALPLWSVPAAVTLALLAAWLPDVARGQLRPARLLNALPNACFSLGPVVVFAAAGTQPAQAGAAVLILALGAQFLADFAVSAARFALAREADLVSQVKESWVYAIDAALAPLGLVVAQQIHTKPWTALSLVPLLAILDVFARERIHRLESLLELGNAYRGTALVLGDVVEADDGYTGEHCKSVVALALAVGDELSLDAEQRRNLEFAALLHDVGKIAIPKEIINKPGKLDPDEWTLIKTHTVEGQNMLNQVGGFMRDVGAIVRSHHERWDGNGYPDKLAGDNIPLEARIVSVCDTWNAMRTTRSYRHALSHEVALQELLANAGTQFDPRVVQALLRIVDQQHSPAVPGAVASL